MNGPTANQRRRQERPLCVPLVIRSKFPISGRRGQEEALQNEAEAALARAFERQSGEGSLMCGIGGLDEHQKKKGLDPVPIRSSPFGLL